MDHHEYLMKTIIIGEAKVGKSSILSKYMDIPLYDTYIPTIGIYSRLKVYEMMGKKAKVQIWDTAGDSRFRRHTHALLRGCSGFVLVFDKTRIESFNNLADWLEVVKSCHPIDPIVLVGNKDDLEDEEEVSEELAKDFALKCDLVYIEASSYTGHNIDKIFEELVRLILRRYA